MSVGDWLARREMLIPNKIALIDILNSDQQIVQYQQNDRCFGNEHHRRGGDLDRTDHRCCHRSTAWLLVG